jgi:predicted CopG family antitoxin
MDMKGKWIVVDNDVYQRLKALGENGETFSDIIHKLLETYEHMVAPDKEEIESGVNTKPEE